MRLFREATKAELDGLIEELRADPASDHILSIMADHLEDFGLAPASQIIRDVLHFISAMFTPAIASLDPWPYRAELTRQFQSLFSPTNLGKVYPVFPLTARRRWANAICFNVAILVARQIQANWKCVTQAVRQARSMLTAIPTMRDIYDDVTEQIGPATEALAGLLDGEPDTEMAISDFAQTLSWLVDELPASQAHAACVNSIVIGALFVEFVG